MKTKKPAPVRPRTTARPTERPANAPQRRRVLLVDDHPMLRVGLAGVINQQADLEVCCEATTVAEALTALTKSTPDILVTDITMPGRGGLELIKDVKALYPTLPVLVISMHDEMLHAERVLRAGARGYLMKEAGAEKMLQAIRQVLSGQVYVSERMSARIFDQFSGRRVNHSPVSQLTDREFEVFQLIGEGMTTKHIAQQLNLSSKTIDVHRGHIKEKLALPDATSLVRHAVRWVEMQANGQG